MDYSLIVSPVVGGIIGYFTNWLAIKMLFLPHREIYVNGVKLPFTPGVLPKSRKRLAKTTGETVASYLLTDETLKEAIMNGDIDESLIKIMDEAYVKLKNNEKTVEHYLKAILSQDYDSVLERAEESFANAARGYLRNDELLTKLSDEIMAMAMKLLSENKCGGFLDNASEWIKDYLDKNKADIFSKEKITDAADGFVLKLYSDSKAGKSTLRDFLSDSGAGQIKSGIAVYLPKASAFLVQMIEESDTLNENLLAITKKVVEGSLGSFIGSMIYQRVYASVKGSLLEYLANEENLAVFSEKINAKLDEFLDTEVEKAEEKFAERHELFNSVKEKLTTYIADNSGLLIEKADGFINRAIEPINDMSAYEALKGFMPDFELRLREFISNAVKSVIEDNAERVLAIGLGKVKDFILGKRVKDILSAVGDDNYEKLKAWVLKRKGGFIESASAAISKKINIAKIVEDKINELDIALMERIILDVASRELNYITYMGGVLGAVIGLLPAVANLLNIYSS